MGVHISFVRSRTMDDWTEKQLNSMKFGGNKQMMQFWEAQSFPGGLSLREKYDNRAMDAYREALRRAATEGNDFIEPPFIGFQKRIRTPRPRKINLTPIGNSGRRKRQEEEEEPDWGCFQCIGDLASNVVAAVKARTATQTRV